MRILSHRGYWKETAEKNTPTAFRRSFELGFGTETDVRDANGVLVISHDMPLGGEMTLDEFIALYADCDLPLAINIKADGMAETLTKQFSQANIAKWFAFDMSVPDMRGYLRAGAPTFARMSEVERDPAWLDQAAGVWLDAFETQWWDAATLDALLTQKRVCVVSPELHRRNPGDVWSLLKPFSANDSLTLCTDRPEEARDFFGEQR